MSHTAASRPTDGAPTSAKYDATGRSRLVRNVLSGWGSYVVYIVAGFVLPRIIDQELKQEALGVWDFCWSIVSYFVLAQAGIGSSVHRFFAAQRAAGDVEGLRVTASTLTAILVVVAAIVLLMAGAAAGLLPAIAAEKIGHDLVPDARWVIVLLGLNLAVQQVTDVFNSVMTGCHRWELHNALNSGGYALTVIAMIAALLLGFRLPALALITLIGTLLSQVARAVACYRICPELVISPRYVRGGEAKKLMSFGGKVFVPRIADLLMEQTVSVLITWQLGVGALAMFARPRGLFRHSTTLVGRLAFVLEPMAGAMQSTGDKAELRGILVRATQAGALIALPVSVLLLVLGDPILSVWMGPDYAVGAVLPVLAIGNTLSVAQLPVHSVLIGLNAHGRVGVAKLIAAVIAVLLAAVLMGVWHLGLLGAAIAVTIPMIAVGGVYVPLRACQLLEMNFGRYCVEAWTRPLLCQLPFAAALIAALAFVQNWNIVALGATLAISGGLLAIVYWLAALPTDLKERVTRKLRKP